MGSMFGVFPNIWFKRDDMIPEEPIETFYILTEEGDYVLTEESDRMLTEEAP